MNEVEPTTKEQKIKMRCQIQVTRTVTGVNYLKNVGVNTLIVKRSMIREREKTISRYLTNERSNNFW